MRVWRGEAPPMPPGLRSPMPLVGRPRGGMVNCLCPRRPRPPLTEPAVGRELDPYAQLEEDTHLRDNRHTCTVLILGGGRGSQTS